MTVKVGDRVLYAGSARNVEGVRCKNYKNNTANSRRVVAGALYTQVKIKLRANMSSWVNLERCEVLEA